MTACGPGPHPWTAPLIEHSPGERRDHRYRIVFTAHWTPPGLPSISGPGPRAPGPGPRTTDRTRPVPAQALADPISALYGSRVKHLVYGQKTLFIDDEAADLLIDFAAHLAQLRTGGRVDVRGYSSDGNEVVTTFLLNSGSSLAAETTTLRADAPDNADAIAYMRGQIDRFTLDGDFFAGFPLLDEEPADRQSP